MGESPIKTRCIDDRLSFERARHRTKKKVRNDMPTLSVAVRNDIPALSRGGSFSDVLSAVRNDMPTLVLAVRNDIPALTPGC